MFLAELGGGTLKLEGAASSGFGLFGFSQGTMNHSFRAPAQTTAVLRVSQASRGPWAGHSPSGFSWELWSSQIRLMGDF